LGAFRTQIIYSGFPFRAGLLHLRENLGKPDCMVHIHSNNLRLKLVILRAIKECAVELDCCLNVMHADDLDGRWLVVEGAVIPVRILHAP
ncbi:MAG TPA: hypothetical protein DCY42_06485, partial [Chloroflexi bacterium]|nr:hypothetical protein [Chloroflexota bacterium]